MTGARYAIHGAVAVVTLDNPPVNGLGHAVRSGIAAGLARAAADPSVKAVVLIGAGRAFSGGADLRELGTPAAAAEPTLGEVIRAVEACPKPVVAAVHGAAMGGGLELALSCHARVAAPGAQVALPEVKLGIVPGAGGTQRLPRAIGVETALELIASGAARPAESLSGTGLFDALFEGDLLRAAVAHAEELAARPRRPALLRERAVAPPSDPGFLDAARARFADRTGHAPAPAACVEAVAAAGSRPFEEGLRLERELFERLVQTGEARALRHAFLAERAATRIPDVPDDTPARPVRSAAVVGAGTMGGGIAMCFAAAGLPVTVLETRADALERGLAAIRATWEGGVRKGRMTAAQLEERMALVRPTMRDAELAGADVVVEAVFEELSVKEAVFRRLDEVMQPGAILATNTSTLDVNRIAGFTRRPQDVVGLHFFSPAHVMKLLEVVRGAATGHDVLATAMALARRLQKTAVVSGVCDGFIGNRMLDAYRRQALFLLEEGALPQQVDGALERWGMAMGPFRTFDLAGNDVSWAIRKRRYVERPELRYSRLADRICELGRFGQKTGAGWYRYEPGGREALPDPAVEALVVGASRELGVERRAIADDEVVDRCVLALVNEGAKVLGERIALRASDVDLVWLTGYGFPRWRGGPMFHAGALGLDRVVRTMERFARSPHGDPGFWRPAPLLARLAAEGGSFA